MLRCSRPDAVQERKPHLSLQSGGQRLERLDEGENDLSVPENLELDQDDETDKVHVDEEGPLDEEKATAENEETVE